MDRPMYKHNGPLPPRHLASVQNARESEKLEIRPVEPEYAGPRVAYCLC